MTFSFREHETCSRSNLIDFRTARPKPVDEAISYALAVAGEVITDLTMKAPLGAVYRNESQVREFWLSFDLDGLAGVWAQYEDGESRLIKEALLSCAEGDTATELVLQRFKTIARALTSAAFQETKTAGAPKVEVRFAPTSDLIEVRADGVALAWWSSQKSSTDLQKLN